MTYLTWEQKRFIINATGDAGLILFEWMMSKSSVEEFEFTDELAAKATGWTERKCREVRYKLQKANLYKKETLTGSSRSMNFYTIGEAIQGLMDDKKKVSRV